MIRIRFVTCSDAISATIRLAENFWASHVEAVTPAGLYLGAHADGGVQSRPVGYDSKTLQRELFVDLPATDQQTSDFYAYLESRIGEPYDFDAILGFVLRRDVHAKDHAICSALQVLATRKCGWFNYPLSQHAHEISPRDYLLMLSGQVNIPNSD